MSLLEIVHHDPRCRPRQRICVCAQEQIDELLVCDDCEADAATVCEQDGCDTAICDECLPGLPGDEWWCERHEHDCGVPEGCGDRAEHTCTVCELPVCGHHAQRRLGDRYLCEGHARELDRDMADEAALDRWKDERR